MSGKKKEEVDLRELQKILKDCCIVEQKLTIQMGKYTERTKRPIYNNNWDRRKEEKKYLKTLKS